MNDDIHIIPLYNCQQKSESRQINQNEYLSCLSKHVTRRQIQIPRQLIPTQIHQIIPTIPSISEPFSIPTIPLTSNVTLPDLHITKNITDKLGLPSPETTINELIHLKKTQVLKVFEAVRNSTLSLITPEVQQEIGEIYFDALVNGTFVHLINNSVNLGNIFGDNGWPLIKNKQRKNFASQILKKTENAMNQLSCLVRYTNSSIAVHRTNLDAEAFAFDGYIKKEFQFPSEHSNIAKGNKISFSAEIELQQMNVNREQCFHKFTGYGLVIENISEMLVDNDQFEINSALIGFSFGKEDVVLLNNTKVWVQLKHLKSKPRGDVSKCVFWNYTIEEWSSNGCTVIYTSKTKTVCECNHLTNFAVLLDISGRELPSETKTILSLTCAAISSASLFATIIVLYLTEEQNTSILVKPSEIARRKKITITMNLCLVLLLLNLVVSFGLQMTENAVICQSISMFLFYIISCCFLWMLLEGVIAYQMITTNLPKTGYVGSFFLYIVGYGISMVWFAVALAVFGPTGFYNSELICWISQNPDKLKMLVLLIPLIIICAANLIVIGKSGFFIFLFEIALNNERRRKINKLFQHRSQNMQIDLSENELSNKLSS
ncbi:7 transmembrane receptor (Secretin family)-like protein 2 [Leptotrombidium deliense]|uniref:7 transmembrane receptor (Secretin family)-like protein 2 n=1 Tax=Leptotrombidium deliense TaxID=299467 RepID=A0A443SCR4_9ACAR|nr:7 transmembrane receptor (Secretin family)-like protein 2 [Leptotrombidium deliense]